MLLAPKMYAFHQAAPHCAPNFPATAPCPEPVQVKTIDTPRVRLLANTEVKKRQAALEAYAQQRKEGGSSCRGSAGGSSRGGAGGAPEALHGSLLPAAGDSPPPCLRSSPQSWRQGVGWLLRSRFVLCLQARRSRRPWQPWTRCAPARAAARRTPLVGCPCTAAAPLQPLRTHLQKSSCGVACLPCTASTPGAALPSTYIPCIGCAALGARFCVLELAEHARGRA